MKPIQLVTDIGLVILNKVWEPANVFYFGTRIQNVEKTEAGINP